MLTVVKRYVPRRAKEAIKNSFDFLKDRRPELRYLELHLTDHCNLNCKGCAHYAPIATPRYADLLQHDRDMRKLAQIFRSIRLIRLMGGEPLLHPSASEFITLTRSAFPRSELRLVTNGILLHEVSEKFWDAARLTRTTIDLTLYPPFRQRLPELISLCHENEVGLSVIEKGTFVAHHNPKGDSDKNRALVICSKRIDCPFLQDGRIYHCAKGALIHNFNREFCRQITPDQGINIHSPGMSGRRILRWLRKPSETCRFCSYEFVPFNWGVSNRLAEEWDAVAEKHEKPQGPFQALQSNI